MRDIRRRMAAGEELPHCAACAHNEKHNGTSYRLLSNERWIDRNPALQQAIESAVDWATPTGPLLFDLRFGNLCNLKCTACKPLYSSQIERDPVHAPWVIDAPHARLPSRFGGDADWSEAGGLIDEIMDLSGDLRSIQLAGGEPTINKTQIGWLRRICDAGRAPDIDLSISTNLSNVRPEVFALFQRFKTLEVVLSIDGHGPTYEYVRYPGKWANLTRNIVRLREVRPDATISINFVLQAVNAFNLVELIDWALDENIKLLVSIGRGLDHYNDFRILPPVLRARIRAALDAMLRRRSNHELSTLRANIAAVFDEIDATDFTEDQRRSHVVGFMQFVNDMDTSRGLSFRTIEPKIHEGVAAYCGEWDEGRRFAK